MDGFLPLSQTSANLEYRSLLPAASSVLGVVSREGNARPRPRKIRQNVTLILQVSNPVTLMVLPFLGQDEVAKMRGQWATRNHRA